MSIDLKEWDFLWDGSEPGWVISNLGTDEHPRYSFFNEIKNHVLLIEIEDDDYNYLIDTMIKKGMRIVKDV